MNQTNLFQRSCQEHPHKQVIYACYHKSCLLNRILCMNCMKLHSAHSNDLLDQQEIEEKIKESSFIFKSFFQKQNQKFDDITSQFKILISKLEASFNFQLEQLSCMENKKLNQYLNLLVEQSEKEIILNQLFTQGLNDFQRVLNDLKQQINKFLNNLSLEEQGSMEKTENYYKQGKEYFDNDYFLNAIKMFDKALQINQNHFLSLFQKGESLRLIGSPKESIHWFDKAHAINPQYQQISCGKGDSLRMMDQYQESIEWYDKALEIDPQNKFALNGKGDSLRLLGQYKESIEWFDKGLVIDPQNKLALFGKGESLRMMNQHKASIEWLEKALVIDPQYKLALFGKGESLRMMGQYNESIEWFDKVLAIAPEYKQARYSKGESLRLLQKYNEALKQLNSALEIDSNYELCLGSKGACLIEMGQFGEAEKCLNSAIKLNPQRQFNQNQLKKLQEQRKK